MAADAPLNVLSSCRIDFLGGVFGDHLARGRDHPGGGRCGGLADLKVEHGLSVAESITTDAKVIPSLVSRQLDDGTGLDDAFIRKWNYYLQYCEAAFATRNISVVQAVYTRPNNATLHQAF